MLVTQKAPNIKGSAVLANGEIVDNFDMQEYVGSNPCVVFFYPLDFTIPGILPSRPSCLNAILDIFNFR